MTSDLTRADIKELLTSLAQMGGLITAEIKRVATDPYLTTNLPMLVLSSLDDAPLRPSDVMNLTGLSSSGTTKLLTRMEKAGYISRARGANQNDLREVEITITDEGRTYLQAVFTAVASRHEDIRHIAKAMNRILDD